jgi:hypothetical protein
MRINFSYIPVRTAMLLLYNNILQLSNKCYYIRFYVLNTKTGIFNIKIIYLPFTM